MKRKMKDSGIDWIGEIPEDWEVVKTKNVYNNFKQIVGDKVDYYERLSLTLDGVLKRSKEDANGLQPTAFVGYQILGEKDLVFKLIDLENVNTSRVGLSPYTGLVSPAYIVLRNREASRFGYYYFLSMWHREIFNKLGGDGVRSNLNVKDLLNIPYLLISDVSQQTIANFLDQKCSEIDHILEKTRESIEEYKKLKQSIITEAVTKGLDRNVEMKESGIEWIGEIPKHWKMGRLKQITDVVMGQSPKSEDYNTDNVGYPFLQGNADFSAKSPLERVYTLSASKFSTIGDVLLSVRAPVGAKNISDKTYAIGRGLCAVRPTLLNDNYLWWLIDLVNIEFSINSRGSTFDSITVEDVRNALVALPSKSEQQSIANYLDQKCSEIDSLISQKETLLTDLEAYKKSLIFECVTGKREVM